MADTAGEVRKRAWWNIAPYGKHETSPPPTAALDPRNAALRCVPLPAAAVAAWGSLDQHHADKGVTLGGSFVSEVIRDAGHSTPMML